MRIALAVLALAACNEVRDSDIEGTQSFAVTLVSPANPGSIDDRLPDTRSFEISVEARDVDNQLDPSVSGTLQVYAQFLGTLTPEFGSPPLGTIAIANGQGGGTISLPASVRLFGPTVIWVDNGTGPGPDYVHGTIAGTSPTIWFRDPFIADLQTPADELAVNALTSTPLTDKQITVGGPPGTVSAALGSKYAERGRMVVTSTFAQGYTVSDVQCADAEGTPPCVAGGYDHAMVFTFSAPRTECGAMQVGQLITGFSGGLSEFNGLTEIGFPQTFSACENGSPIVNTAQLPAPAVFEEAWFRPLSDPSGGMINFERNEAAPIQINNARVCDLDDDFTTFKQWKLDPSGAGGDCSDKDNVLNVITTGITGIDPMALVGQTVPRVVGVLRPVNIGSFNVWIIFPRSPDDIDLP